MEVGEVGSLLLLALLPDLLGSAYQRVVAVTPSKRSLLPSAVAEAAVSIRRRPLTIVPGNRMFVAMLRSSVQIRVMPIVYEFVADVLMGRASGTYPLSDVDSVLSAAVADPRRPGELRGALLDVRGSDVVGKRTMHELRDTAFLIAAMSRSFGRRVALLTGNDLQYGVMRMLSAWAETSGAEVAVFRDQAEAFAWVTRDARSLASGPPSYPSPAPPARRTRE